MGKHDWYRNADWNHEIERAFRDKLRRARDKSQYLRIQASSLSAKHPEVSLRLLEEYFALGIDSDLASGFYDQAEAYISLERYEDALDSLRRALRREKEFPNYQTQAWKTFVLLVATRKFRQHYEEALRILDEALGARGRAKTLFPVDAFSWHAARALIEADSGHIDIARENAQKALEYAQIKHSGFRYHANVGLVGPDEADILRSLQRLLDGGKGGLLKRLLGKS